MCGVVCGVVCGVGLVMIKGFLGEKERREGGKWMGSLRGSEERGGGGGRNCREERGNGRGRKKTGREVE